MEKQSKNIDRITKKIIKDAGLEQPSTDFFSNVMEAIESQSTSASMVYQPLISKKIWMLLSALIAVVLVLLFIFPVFSETSLINPITIPEQFKFSFNLPEIKLSKTTIYGVGFLSLFLLQIPFLKRQLNNSY